MAKVTSVSVINSKTVVELGKKLQKDLTIIADLQVKNVDATSRIDDLKQDINTLKDHLQVEYKKCHDLSTELANLKRYITAKTRKRASVTFKSPHSKWNPPVHPFSQHATNCSMLCEMCEPIALNQWTNTDAKCDHCGDLVDWSYSAPSMRLIACSSICISKLNKTFEMTNADWASVGPFSG